MTRCSGKNCPSKDRCRRTEPVDGVVSNSAFHHLRIIGDEACSFLVPNDDGVWVSSVTPAVATATSGQEEKH